MSGTNSDLVPDVNLYGFDSTEDSDGRQPTIVITVDPVGSIQVGVCRFTPPARLIEVMSRAMAKVAVFINQETSRAEIAMEELGSKEAYEDIVKQVTEAMIKDRDSSDR